MACSSRVSERERNLYDMLGYRRDGHRPEFENFCRERSII
jgi:hypothetical protein